MSRSTLTPRRITCVGLLSLAAALASSNGSQASPIIERGWDLFETVSGPAQGTVFDFDDAGPMAPIPFTGVPLGSFDFTTGTDGDFGRGIGVRGTGTADAIVKRLDIAELGIDKTEPPGPILPEPETLLLLSSGLAGVVMMLGKRTLVNRV